MTVKVLVYQKNAGRIPIDHNQTPIFLIGLPPGSPFFIDGVYSNVKLFDRDSGKAGLLLKEKSTSSSLLTSNQILGMIKTDNNRNHYDLI